MYSKYLIVTILTLFLTSCSLGGRTINDLDDMAGIDTPEIVSIKWNIKKMDYSLEPWDYVNQTKCGWVYDGWMNQFNGDNVCNYICLERPKYDYRDDLWYTSLERCLYFDYRGGH
ncbi:MAG: hypothetical protein KAS32_27760 [Candidatus Peribacteraceae bacterium]|nr:hypothetical protein [Candidatus Peribacteraceae bacterium]